MIILQNSHYKDNTEDVFIFPGSFNPFHAGHLEICDKIHKEYNRLPILEISIKNVDKDSINTKEVWKRLLDIESYSFPAIATITPTFADKILFWAEQNKKQTYILGLDTWNRLHQPHYYPLDQLYDLIEEHEVSFLIFNRGNDNFINPGIQRVKYYKEFNHQISSSQLRNS